MPSKQLMRLQNEKHSKNVANRGNVPKTLVKYNITCIIAHYLTRQYNFFSIMGFRVIFSHKHLIMNISFII